MGDKLQASVFGIWAPVESVDKLLKLVRRQREMSTQTYVVTSYDHYVVGVAGDGLVSAEAELIANAAVRRARRDGNQEPFTERGIDVSFV